MEGPPVVGRSLGIVQKRERERKRITAPRLPRSRFICRAVDYSCSCRDERRQGKIWYSLVSGPFYTPERTFSLRVKYPRTHHRENFLPRVGLPGYDFDGSSIDTKPVADVVSLRIEYLVHRNAKITKQTEVYDLSRNKQSPRAMGTRQFFLRLSIVSRSCNREDETSLKKFGVQLNFNLWHEDDVAVTFSFIRGLCFGIPNEN